ncbi:ABC-ATPase domain-containing protein [Kocuria rhizophila]|nr:ABC-ATPase domain-containing protein [Kocuria rhizophila]
MAFVADGAVLPRASGHRDEPLAHGRCRSSTAASCAWSWSSRTAPR